MSAPVALAAFIVALGPIRQAGRLNGLSRSQILLAAGFSVAAVCGLAGLSGPLLDALSVSVPTLRIGAGLTLAVTSLIRLVRPLLPGEEPVVELDSRLVTGLVPAAFPVLIQPVLAMVALSVGADRGWLQAGLLSLPALALWSLLCSRAPLRHAVSASRSVAIFGLVVGVIAVVDGVMDV